LLCGFNYRGFDRLGEMGIDEAGFWVEIIFPGLIDYAEVPDLDGIGV
jgi:hypothetical protein